MSKDSTDPQGAQYTLNSKMFEKKILTGSNYGKTYAQAFQEKLNSGVKTSSGCLLWSGAVDEVSGYGYFYFRGKLLAAHRIAYALHYGECPANMCVLHRCDTRNCVCWSDLFLGTRAENCQDRINKGRSNYVSPGPNNPLAKITLEKALELWGRVQNGESQTKLARETGIPQGTLSRIFTGVRWPNTTHLFKRN